MKDKHGREIRVGDVVRDGHGVVGTVVENMHPWGFKRLQYSGLSITYTAGEDWYEIIDKRWQCPECGEPLAARASWHLHLIDSLGWAAVYPSDDGNTIVESAYKRFWWRYFYLEEIDE